MDEMRKRHLREYNAYALGGIRALDTFTQERFRISTGNDKALEAAVAFDAGKDNLYLWGSTGGGKSHLAAIAARKYLGRMDVATMTQMILGREVRGAETAAGEGEVLKRYMKIPILVLDDLGVGKDTEFNINLLYEIIHGRYMNRPGGLIVTSNLSLGQLAEKIGDDRISSRLAQMCAVFNLSGEKDARLGER